MLNYKAIISASFLIIALAVAYYFVIFLPHKDQEQIDLQKQEAAIKQQQQADTLKAALDKKRALDNCLNNTDTNYNQDWRNECRVRGLLPSGCDEDTINISFKEYQMKNNLSGDNGFLDYLKWSDATEKKCTCSLPMTIADAVNLQDKDAKDLCLKQYPQ